MKSQKAILRAITENTDRSYLEAIEEIDDVPNILEVFFMMLAKRRLAKSFVDNRKKFLELSKKLDYDPTGIMNQFNDVKVNNDHLYFSLMNDFSQKEKGQFLNVLKDKLK
tara:strand:+ start:479 stop:808 length:330 start_codon:yes stop_codon:yes gene_type:complete